MHPIILEPAPPECARTRPTAGLPATGPIRGSETFRLAVPGMLLVLACLLPYLNKAYTLDDSMFLLSARQILHSPLQPFSFARCWEPVEPCGMIVARVGAGATQSLMGYLLVPVVLAGSPEWMAHTLQTMVACIAVLGTVALALRLGLDRKQAVLAGLLLAAIPPFLPVASTVMPDTLAVALGVAGMERLLAWRTDRRWHLGAAAAIALALAAYSRPHAALLMPLGALWLCQDFRVRDFLRQLRSHARVLAPAFAAAAILAALILLTRDRSGAEVPQNLLVRPNHIPRNIYTYFLYLCFPIPLALIWLPIHLGRKTLLWLLLPVLPIAILHFKLSPEKSLADEWGKVGLIYGFMAMVHLLRTFLRRADRVGLFLALWILIPLPLIVYDHFPIKYLAIALPAAIVVIIRTLWLLRTPVALSLSSALVLGFTAFSCVVLRADADFADCARTAAAQLVRPHVAAGERVWYSGIAGFYWYAAEAGAKIPKPGQQGPNPGDLLAVAVPEGGAVTRNRYPNRELVALRRFPVLHGRTSGWGGGLHNNFDGDSIWVWRPDSTWDYELWRIR